MMRWVHWACAGLLAFALAGPALGARAYGSDEPDKVEQARKCAQLIQRGQLALRDAVTLAEKHVRGTALEVRLEIKTAVEKPQRPEKPEKPEPAPDYPAVQQPAGDRLMYEISCITGDKVQLVRVDGLEKKVVNVIEQTSPKRER